MEVIPAVDLKDGQVVRLTRGDPTLSKSYSSLGGPLSVAKMWVDEGAKTIHIVDLDAALGLGSNLTIIKRMVKTLDVDFQVGGGIRSFHTAQSLIDIGVKRIILGTMAFRDEETLIKLLENCGEEKIVVSLDHYGREVMVKGWRVSSRIDIHDAITNFIDLGVRIFLVTSIKRDGTLTRPDFKILAEMLEIKEAKVIAAGGISKLEHLSKLRDMGVYGVVVGKALYEDRFTLKDAIDIAKEEGG
ncbi:MAG: 1-(5-phosphoribosyl)-5-[(5-phosphoribosylamino)methylideneamino]imidazole-4-carboxamide isomerase [archaeon]|nr:1-(5-phosphoribosyl)-5-[(5-phosphoribosylamino)methylideneamino]imidazole-4-carboxamide isomerase [archaeon]MCP8306085.1 1-(5-phosphoribosyl)-5-[(5-phosphoribosylamino)methylideneamino]imidazole-4-carboxamide isomerase [archaeon]